MQTVLVPSKSFTLDYPILGVGLSVLDQALDVFSFLNVPTMNVRKFCSDAILTP